MGPESIRPVLLGCDTGEASEGAGRDRELGMLVHVTAASIACGGHAGDEGSMRAMVEGCVTHGCLIGAHPSYPDRVGFGRRAIEIDPKTLWASVGSQIANLGRVCARAGVSIGFIKPHGALYHSCAQDPAFAEGLAGLVLRRFPRVALVGPAGSEAIEVWRSMGMTVISEGFADRVYEGNGELRSRVLADALIDDPERAANQAVRLARGEGVLASDGSTLPLRAGMICVHADTAGMSATVERVRRALEANALLRAD